MINNIHDNIHESCNVWYLTKSMGLITARDKAQQKTTCFIIPRKNAQMLGKLYIFFRIEPKNAYRDAYREYYRESNINIYTFTLYTLYIIKGCAY